MPSRLTLAAQEFRDALLEAYEDDYEDIPEWIKLAAFVHHKASKVHHPAYALRLFLEALTKGDGRDLH